MKKQKPLPNDVEIGVMEAARIIGISHSAVSDMGRLALKPNYRGQFPAPHRFTEEGHPRWWRSAIIAYAEKRKKGEVKKMYVPTEKTILLKITPDGGVTPAHPDATPGPLESGGYIVAVDGVPRSAGYDRVINAYRNTTVYHTPGGGYRVRYDELGPGKIVRA